MKATPRDETLQELPGIIVKT